MGRLLLIPVLLLGCAHIPQTSLQVVEVPPPPLRHIPLGEVNLPNARGVLTSLVEAVENHESEVILDIDSPGGSVGIGLALIELMKQYQRDGLVITCRVDGMAASMAAVIFETGCSKRYMNRTAALMFHEPSIGEIGGKEWELRKWADRLADTNKRIAIMVAPALGMTAQEYCDWVKDRDRWISVEEAVAMGAADG